MGKMTQEMRARSRRMAKRIVVFTDKYPFIGPIFWMLSAQYFIVQIIVASAWTTPFSWKTNFISDLGNTVCEPYAVQYICSPLHDLMNASFIFFGLTLFSGSMLIYTEFKRSVTSLIGFSLMALSGVGTVLVGAFPENTVTFLHLLGAALSLGVGNLSLVLLAIALEQVRLFFRVYTFATGVICLTAFGLFASNTYLGLGAGTIERIASYPFALWLILFGIYMSAVRVRARKSQNNN